MAPRDSLLLIRTQHRGLIEDLHRLLPQFLARRPPAIGERVCSGERRVQRRGWQLPKSRTQPFTQLSGPEHDGDCLSVHLVGGTQSDSHNLGKRKDDDMMCALELDAGEFEFSLHMALSGQVTFL